MAHQYDALAKAADAVAARLGRAPVGVVLGSGLSEALEGLDGARFMEYGEIPGMPSVGATGHRGSLMRGTSGDNALFALCGRVHLYEGRPLEEICTPVRLLSLLGVHTLVVTSLVSTLDEDLPPGSVMLVTDHINLSGMNVLAHDIDTRMGSRYTDMRRAYEPSLFDAFLEASGRASLSTSSGVLAHLLGPSYETPAEAAMAKSLGARVVSMSMVPEVLVARQRGMRVAGLACVGSRAANLTDEPVSHENVLRASAAMAQTVEALVLGALPKLAHKSSA